MQGRGANQEGDVIITDAPFCSQLKAPDDPWDLDKLNWHIDNPNCHAYFKNLTARPDEADKTLGVLKNNAMSFWKTHSGIGFGPQDGAALYLAVSRLNHSCDPNARVLPSLERAEVIALRAIKKGEEVCTSYMPAEILRQNHEQRSKFLAEFEIVCRCSRCKEEISSRTNEDQWSWIRVEPHHVEVLRKQFDAVSPNVSQSGYLSWNEAMIYYGALSRSDLHQIWKLVDVDGDNRLAFKEFVCAEVLAQKRLRDGVELPEQLPPSLVALIETL